MNKEELRNEFVRLYYPKTIPDCILVIDKFCNFFITVVARESKNSNSEAEREAKIILQMIMTKALHLKSIINGISYDSINGISLKDIIDPTIVSVLIRNAYEMIALFNLIFRANKKGDERDICYNLWTISGLKYRQGFESVIQTDETYNKFIEEQTNIANLIAEIEKTKLYRGLDERNKCKIQSQIKIKSYLVRFENNQVIVLTWKDLYKTLDVKEGIFNHAYSYFSLYAHPTNVSVFQFRDMFNSIENTFMSNTTFNLQYFFMFLGIFAADYINLFPDTIKIYNELELIDQIIINAHNTFTRDSSYSINDASSALN